jgi:hypothetical protein
VLDLGRAHLGVDGNGDPAGPRHGERHEQELVPVGGGHDHAVSRRDPLADARGQAGDPIGRLVVGERPTATRLLHQGRGTVDDRQALEQRGQGEVGRAQDVETFAQAHEEIVSPRTQAVTYRRAPWCQVGQSG